MATQNEILDRAFRAIDALVGRPIAVQKESLAARALATKTANTNVFPHCPRCASYALYRRNNIGHYACMTCELQGISEDVARRTH
jgi:hypothetical protein